MEVSEFMELKEQTELDIVNIIRKLNMDTGIYFDDLKFVCYKTLSNDGNVLNINYECRLRPNLD